MKRSILSTAVWLTILIDRQAWEVFEWNWSDDGFRSAVANLIDDHDSITDGVMEGYGGWDDLYYC